MTFEKTPEQTATINDGTGGMWSAKYTYTSFGAVSTRQDARGVVTSYFYDTLNRLFNVSYQLPNPNPDNVQATTGVTISFGSAAPEKGLVKTVSDGSGGETFNYDSLSRLASRTKTIDGVNYTTSYEYNQTGQLKRMTYPSNRKVDVAYDTRGRLSALTGADPSGSPRSYITSTSYNAAQQMTNLNLANGVSESYGYSASRLQLTSQMVSKGASKLMEMSLLPRRRTQ